MGRGSTFLQPDDVVIKASKLKALERAASESGAEKLEAELVEARKLLDRYRIANENLSAQNDALRAQVDAL